MAALCINKQLDLQSLFTDIGRVIAWKQGWYQERREFQKWFVLGVLATSLLATAFLVFRFRGFWKSHFLLAPGWCFCSPSSSSAPSRSITSRSCSNPHGRRQSELVSGTHRHRPDLAGRRFATIGIRGARQAAMETRGLRNFFDFFQPVPTFVPPPVADGGVMNDNLTEIAFILDRSGSMESMVEPAISGFNRLLREQQQEPGTARFTLVLFDDQYEVPFHSVPIAEVVELDTNTFVPRGSTALLDAIGPTIDELGAKLAALPEADRPGQVIVAILTDGMENASHRYTLAGHCQAHPPPVGHIRLEIPVSRRQPGRHRHRRPNEHPCRGFLEFRHGRLFLGASTMR